QLVAHVGPRHLAANLDLEALALEGTRLLGQHNRRAVDDRDESDFELRSIDVRHAPHHSTNKNVPLGRHAPVAQDAIVQPAHRHWSATTMGAARLVPNANPFERRLLSEVVTT